MFKELNPLLHSELRLAVMSLLIGVEEADFVFIRQQTGATAGNLSVQIDKLNKAGYVEVTKTFKGKMPCTLCKITPQGVDAFEEYVEALKTYIIKGIMRITSEVSLTARPFFEKRGYIVEEEQKRKANQLSLTNFWMAKQMIYPENL